MTARLTTGRDAALGAPYDGVHQATVVTIPEPDSTRGVPFASVSYGPLLFALPIPDTVDANTPDSSVPWQFALDVQDAHLTVERAAMPAVWDWPLEPPLVIRANAIEFAWNPDPHAPRLAASACSQANHTADCEACPLRLHQVSDLHVSGNRGT